MRNVSMGGCFGVYGGFEGRGIGGLGICSPGMNQ
jgi:hypothetical protein